MGERTKYAVLCSALKKKISDGVFQPGRKITSEMELAKEFGFSRQTVRQALNVLEQEGLIERRRGSGTFVKETVRRKHNTGRIGVITTYVTDYIFPHIIRGIEEEATRNGYRVVLGATKNRVEYEKKLLTAFLEDGIDGLIIEGTKSALPNPNTELFRRMDREGIPYTFLNAVYPELSEAVSLKVNDRKCGFEGTSLMLQRGCGKIGGIFKSDDKQGHERYAGYAAALLENGKELDDEAVFWYTTNDMEKLFRQEGDFLLDKLSVCDGVMCYNDQIAYNLIRIFLRAGIRVPEDKMVVGVDNSSLSEFSPVRITTFDYPKEEISRLLTQKLIRMIETGKKESSELFDMRMILKGSVAGSPAERKR